MMGGYNLPPGVTPADIDDEFGEPETKSVRGDVIVAVDVETQFFDSKREMKEELKKEFERGNWEQVVDVEIHEVV